jgi:uncharacterized protein with HEPN domain
MVRESIDYIQDIIAAMDKAQMFTKRLTYNSFIKDEKTVFAVIRALEIIGEAVKNVPAALKRKYPTVPWKEMAGMRDKLIHGYFGINVKVVWDTVKTEIPGLKAKIKKIKGSIREKLGE